MSRNTKVPLLIQGPRRQRMCEFESLSQCAFLPDLVWPDSNKWRSALCDRKPESNVSAGLQPACVTSVPTGSTRRLTLHQSLGLVVPRAPAALCDAHPRDPPSAARGLSTQTRLPGGECLFPTFLGSCVPLLGRSQTREGTGSHATSPYPAASGYGFGYAGAGALAGFTLGPHVQVVNDDAIPSDMHRNAVHGAHSVKLAFGPGCGTSCCLVCKWLSGSCVQTVNARDIQWMRIQDEIQWGEAQVPQPNLNPGIL